MSATTTPQRRPVPAPSSVCQLCKRRIFWGVDGAERVLAFDLLEDPEGTYAAWVWVGGRGSDAAVVRELGEDGLLGPEDYQVRLHPQTCPLPEGSGLSVHRPDGVLDLDVARRRRAGAR